MKIHKQHDATSATFIFGGRFIDVMPEKAGFAAYEICPDGLAGTLLCTAPTFDQAVSDARIMLAAELHANA